MRIAIAILVLLLALAAPAAAEVDLAIGSVGIEDAGGGLSDVQVVIDARAHGPLAAFTTSATLRLDGIIHDAIIIDYSIYEAIGCTYTADYMGSGHPACYDDPGCDVWTINGGVIPGQCVLVIPGGVPLSCWCSHPWLVIFQNVYLGGTAVMDIIVDEGQEVAEYWEDNNVMSIESPIGIDALTWGHVKGLYR